VKEVASFLVRLGAESALNPQVQTTRVSSIELGQRDSNNNNSTTTSTSEIKAERITFNDSVPMLRGLQVLGDERTNTLTLIGTPKLVEMAVAQVTPLDLRRRQVVVNVKIIDVNLTRDQLHNTSFSFGVGNSFFSNTSGLANINFGDQRPFTTAGATTGSLESLPKRFLAALQAQVTSGNAKILTDPTLIVQEGQTANVQLTQEVIGNIKNEITRGEGSTTQTVTADKQTVGLSLSVKVDRIDDNGFVSLSVAPIVRAPQAPAEIALGTSSQTIFLVSERSLNSGTIRLRDGQTLILSGIIQDQDRATVNKVPILGDIPLLGSLFRRTNRENERREVIVLLTPQVMDDSERSSYGYNYNPSPQVRDMLERRGLRVPGSR
jgi:type IV pilus assembly protein PilQ